MKKEKKKYKVLNSLTESDIKSIAGNRWIIRHWKLLAISFAGFVVWLFVYGKYIDNGSWWDAVAVAIPLVIVYLVWVIGFMQAGKRYWRENKDKPEPIDISEEGK